MGSRKRVFVGRGVSSGDNLYSVLRRGVWGVFGMGLFLGNIFEKVEVDDVFF